MFVTVIPTADLVDHTHRVCNDPTDTSTCVCTDVTNQATCDCLYPDDTTSCSLVWPNLDGTKNIMFRTCGSAADYYVMDMLFTENPPDIEEYVFVSPSMVPSSDPTMELTNTPSDPPTLPPTTSIIFKNTQDAFAYDTEYAATIPPENYTMGEAGTIRYVIMAVHMALR